MILDAYIADLLYRHSCVVVPGFGAFITEWQSAVVHDTQNTFYPPKKAIAFNANIKSNDGLLANYIVSKTQTNYENALDKIEVWVKNTSTLLHQKQTVQLANIGDFHTNSDGNIVFKPTNTINYLTDSFGLSSFNTLEIQRQTIQEKLVVVENEPEFIAIPEKVVEEKVKVVALKQKKKAKQKPKTNYTWLKAAASLVLVSGVGLYGYKMYYDSQYQEQTQIVERQVAEKIKQKIQEASFVLTVPQKEPQIASEPIKETEEVSQTKIVNTPKSEYRCHAIAGVFSSYNNAQRCIAENKALGLDTHYIGVKRGYHQVAYKSFKTRAEANLFKDSLKNTSQLSTWILIE
jgi:hypothetical protein